MLNFALQTNLKILGRKWRNNCKGQPCEDEVFVFPGWGVGRWIKLPCHFISPPCRLLGVTLIWLTSPRNPLPLPSLFATITRIPRVPNRSASVVNRHQDHLCCSILNSHATKLPPPPPPSISPLTPNIPISLPLNGPCVLLSLRRVWGAPSPQFLWMVPFWMFTTVWPNALYSNCVNKMSGGEGHGRHRFKIGSKIVQSSNLRQERPPEKCHLWRGIKSIDALPPCAQLRSKSVMDFCVSFLIWNQSANWERMTESDDHVVLEPRAFVATWPG